MEILKFNLLLCKVWANIYNQFCLPSAHRSKLVFNLVLLVERPIATFAGALAAGDERRSSWFHMYFGMGETLRQAGPTWVRYSDEHRKILILLSGCINGLPTQER